MTTTNTPFSLQDAVRDYEGDTHVARGVLLLAQAAQQVDCDLECEWSGPESRSVTLAILEAGKVLQASGHSLCRQVKAFESAHHLVVNGRSIFPAKVS